MRAFFYLLYHPFAFTYDLVAASVSFGKWKDWVNSVIPFIEGNRILELGHGPGHLQRVLLSRGLFTVAIDESAYMGRIAKHRIGKFQKLTRGLAQSLPFANQTFDSIVSTFPTEYIFDPKTLSEIKRCLSIGGRLVVLPAAWPKSKFLKLLFKVTGESPAVLDEAIKSRFKEPFAQAGFTVETQLIELKSSALFIMIATK